MSTPVAEQPANARERLGRLLAPESVALVGVSEKSHWAKQALGNMEALGHRGAVHLVNRRAEVTFGKPTVGSCQAIGEPVDVAVILVPNAHVPDALRDAAAAGIGGAVLLGSGYAEGGEAGRQAQDELVNLSQELDIRLIGPNCVGFANLVDRASAWLVDTPEPVLPGAVAIVSQSGNIAASVADYCAMLHIGISHLVSTGNEADITATDVMEVLIEDDRVRVIAAFAESIRQPQQFLNVARRAAELRKPIVMFKAGTSELAVKLAESHTGALAGDNEVVDAVLRTAGVVRVDSLEQLAVTAGLLAHTGPLAPGGLAVVSITGGGGDIVADRAEMCGVALPPVGKAANDALAGRLADFATLQNPFDITGAAMADPTMMRDALREMGSDPDVALVACIYAVPKKPRFVELVRGGLVQVGEGLQLAKSPGVLLSNTLEPIGGPAFEVLEETGIPMTIGGFDHGVAAIGDAMRWSAWLRRRSEAEPMPATAPLVRDELGGNWSEAMVLRLLADNGIAVAPHHLATSAEEAVETACSLGYPVAVKVSSGDILHKTDIGGVALGVSDDVAAAEAFEQVVAAGRAVNGAHVDGALVAAMRPAGLELIAGVVRDPAWGLLLAVGFGGVHVNALPDAQMCLLPADENEITAMLGRLRGVELLKGVRGSKPADIDRLARTVTALGRLASGLGPRLVSLEINPLRVDGSEVEALDGAVIWDNGEAAHNGIG
jgi:acyl-CoA synthetase (NDP forming)